MTYAEAKTRRDRLFASYPGVLGRVKEVNGSGVFVVSVSDKRGDETVPANSNVADAHAAPSVDAAASITFDAVWP